MNKRPGSNKTHIKKWRTLHSKIVFKNQWLSLEENEVIGPDGRKGLYTVVDTAPFVVIVAKEQDRVLMVGQHRFTIDSHTLEFPAGGIETGEKPVDAAKRELLEEAGYKAQSWTLAGELDDAIGIARHKAYVFFADDLMLTEADKNLEEHEDVVDSSEWINLDTVKRMIEENRITDTKTIAIFYKLLLAIT